MSSTILSAPKAALHTSIVGAASGTGRQRSYAASSLTIGKSTSVPATRLRTFAHRMRRYASSYVISGKLPLQQCPQGLARTVQPSLDQRLAHAQSFGGLFRGQLLDVAQQ